MIFFWDCKKNNRNFRGYTAVFHHFQMNFLISVGNHQFVWHENDYPQSLDSAPKGQKLIAQGNTLGELGWGANALQGQKRQYD